MSELFKVLKRTKVEKAAPSLPAQEMVPEEPPKVEVLPAIAPESIEPVRAGRFSLDGADRKVRDVLDPMSLPGEQYRLLRAKLAFLQKQRDVRTLLVTSTLPGEGKTLTATCLAGVLAQEAGKRILLVDADMRRSRLRRLLGMDGASEPGGLCEVLKGAVPITDSLLIADGLDFQILAAGRVPCNPSELLCSPRLERLLNEMRERFDWVVLDSPPLMATADATMIAPLVDGIILVVRANKTPSNLIKDAIARLNRDKICGVILNRVDHLHSSRYYYHYYRKPGKTQH